MTQNKRSMRRNTKGPIIRETCELKLYKYIEDQYKTEWEGREDKFLLGGEVLGEDTAVGESVGVGAVEEVVTVLLLVVTVTCRQTVKNIRINVDFL